MIESELQFTLFGSLVIFCFIFYVGSNFIDWIVDDHF